MKKHIYLKFALIIVAAALCGAVMGYGSAMAEAGGALSSAMAALSRGLQQNAPLLLGLNLLLLAAGGWQYQKGRRWAARAQAEDNEELCDKADEAWGWGLTISSASLILNFMFFGFSVNGVATGQIKSGRLLLCLGLFILGMVCVTTLQHLTIRAVQKMNPEKRGNIFDTRFKADWYESCDEAERELIGRSAYHSMQCMQGIYALLFVVLAILSMEGLFSPLIFLLWGGLWLAQSLTYQFQSIKIEHGRRKKR